MRAPRKLYVLVSRKTQGEVDEDDIFYNFREAKNWCARRNKKGSGYLNHDWRIETYVKGD
jgi:hypothetical protein